MQKQKKINNRKNKKSTNFLIKLVILMVALHLIRTNTLINDSIKSLGITSTSHQLDVSLIYFQVFLLVLFLIIVFSLMVKKISNKRWLLKHKSIEDIKKLSWQKFEKLCFLAFEKDGWMVKHTTSGADGGIDLIISKKGETCIVQCKQWKSRVGVKVVREMYGLMHHHKANKAIVMATEGYTSEAKSFSDGKNIVLMDGGDMLNLIGMVKEYDEKNHDKNITKTPLCPLCESEMTPQTNSKTKKQFWGCTKYPKCRGTRNI